METAEHLPLRVSGGHITVGYLAKQDAISRDLINSVTSCVERFEELQGALENLDGVQGVSFGSAAVRIGVSRGSAARVNRVLLALTARVEGCSQTIAAQQRSRQRQEA